MGNKYNNDWTEEQIQYLKDNHMSMTQKDIGLKLNKSHCTVSVMMKRLGLISLYNHKFNWTPEQIDFLKENYKNMTYKNIGIKLDKKEYTVGRMASILGLKKAEFAKNYSDEDIAFLKENIDKLTYKQMAKSLGRTTQSVSSKCSNLGITLSENRTKLKKEQVMFIVANYDKYTDTELGIKFGVSAEAVSDVRKAYGIKKTGNEVKGPTYIEKEIITILENNNIDFIYNEYLEIYKPDFLIGKIIIEINGDYFHCNPAIYGEGPEDDIQIKHVLRDYYKKCYYISRGYKYIEIWEHDIVNSINEVEKKILSAVLNRNI